MKFNSTIVLFILLSSTAWAQTQTPIYLSQTIPNANSRGFYQYLPGDYSSTTKSYPLIIWVHGAGQIGQGNTADLPKILEWGVPKIISEGGFPASFRVNGVDHSFIIISPQFMGWPSAINLGGIISYVTSNYRVDADRIYLMGISAGGGGIWDYASASVANSDKIAAMIPFCGTTNPTQTLASRIAASKLPIWAFHNTHDGTVPVAYSRNWVNYINSYVPAPSPAAKLTEFPVQSNNAVIAHECWSMATLPSYKPEGINIYEWLLQYKRRTTVSNAAPVARAGNDASVVLPATLNLNGSSSSDADGMIAAYRWRKLSGPATHSFSDSTAANTTVSNLSAGTYQFELRVTDNGGATATDNIAVTVYPATSPGTNQRVLIDIGAGTLTTSPSINGLYWNNLTDGRPGIRVSNAVTTSNAPSGINVEVINRLDGTYSTSSSGLGTGNTTGTVNDYPASATTDYQLIHSSATNGLWRITGLNASNVYTIKFWGTMSGTSPTRIAEIKRADESTWKSYSATSNTNFNNAAVFIFSGKSSMDFNIRTQSGSDFSALSVVDISYGGESQPQPNNTPVANA
jgi:predicted esterase